MGYGSVYKLSGNRRKPWVAMVTKEYHLTENGKRVTAKNIKDVSKVKEHRSRHAIGYYATRKEAELALAKFNSDPYDLECTFSSIYERWKATKTLANTSMESYRRAYERFKPLHDKIFARLTVRDLEGVIEATDTSQRNKSLMKLLLNQMYAYALKYDIVQHNLAERFSVAQPKAKIKREALTDEEIKLLWDSPLEEAKLSLIMCYTGVRIGELLTMEIDKDEWLMKGGSKTEAGKNRIVPIRDKIKPLMDYDQDESYNAFYQRVLYFLRKMGHTPHDCRVTFATRYKSADPIAIKLIMGHAIKDITKGVYTKYTPTELRNVIESVDY